MVGEMLVFLSLWLYVTVLNRGAEVRELMAEALALDLQTLQTYYNMSTNILHKAASDAQSIFRAGSLVWNTEGKVEPRLPKELMIFFCLSTGMDALFDLFADTSTSSMFSTNQVFSGITTLRRIYTTAHNSPFPSLIHRLGTRLPETVNWSSTIATYTSCTFSQFSSAQELDTLR
ncbi:hypothetical protein BT96DRAFT_944191 [Gymnopus androsaceus JB14]|uniref:Uncharacterized protein n=1 Tax=Gymnopus androsaceus JB14 TaxID=1447944 RepID=A0A6A4H4I7_9AGAR|nr:hypothetical protein BT96DRAFT_944191 [Gymnopus androsaceus JB14]